MVATISFCFISASTSLSMNCNRPGSDSLAVIGSGVFASSRRMETAPSPVGAGSVFPSLDSASARASAASTSASPVIGDGLRRAGGDGDGAYRNDGDGDGRNDTLLAGRTVAAALATALRCTTGVV